MVRSTTIFRTHDALPLAASVDDETVRYSFTAYATG
jgi:vesicle transport protein SEC22